MTVSTLQAPQKRPCVSPDIPRDGYGFVVTGDSMSSQIEAGDTIYVHPHRRHRSAFFEPIPMAATTPYASLSERRAIFGTLNNTPPKNPSN
jgi:predicted ABC-class ATPase